MADDGGPAIPFSRKNADKDSSRKKRKKKQKSSAKSKRIRYDCTDSSLSSDSKHVDERRKKGKKKVRRARSRSRDRLDGSEIGMTKNRKNKKRKEKNKKKKKKSAKEKSRIRDASVISYSSSSSSEHARRTRRRSRSCSTCRSGSSSPEGRGRGRSIKGRNFDKKKLIDHRRKYRSPSCSSSGGSSYSSRSLSRKRLRKGSRERRSKVVEKGYDSGGADGRVEITQDDADFPSSRSNDSFDGVNKTEGRVTPKQSPQRFVGEESHAETEEKESGFATYAGNLEDAYEGSGVRCIRGADKDVGPSTRLKSIVVVPAESAKVDDLELILRQKALENLKKFRGQISSSVKPPANKNDVLLDSGLSLASDRRVETIQEDHSKEYVSDVSKKNLTIPIIDKGGTQDECSQLVSGGKLAERSPSSMVNLVTTRERNNGDQVTKYTDISIQPQIASDKTSLRPSVVIHKHNDSLRQVQKEQVKHNENPLMSSSLGCGILDLENTKQTHSTVSEIKLALASGSGSSIPDRTAEPNKDNEAKNEPRTDSGLEKKTMTVMRGGEMVQVSYKVYIPKKSPALARRQLQR